MRPSLAAFGSLAIGRIRVAAWAPRATAGTRSGKQAFLCACGLSAAR